MTYPMDAILTGPYKPGLPYRRPSGEDYIRWTMEWSCALQFRIGDVSGLREGSWGALFRPAAIPEKGVLLRVPHPIPGGHGGLTRIMLGMGVTRFRGIWLGSIKSAYTPHLPIDEDKDWAHFAIFWGKSNTPRMVFPCHLNEMPGLESRLVETLRNGVSTPADLRRAVQKF